MLLNRTVQMKPNEYQRTRERSQLKQRVAQAFPESRRSMGKITQRYQNEKSRLQNLYEALKRTVKFEESATRRLWDRYKNGLFTHKRGRTLANTIVMLVLVEKVAAVVQVLLSYFAYIEEVSVAQETVAVAATE